MPGIPNVTASSDPFDLGMWNDVVGAARERILASGRYAPSQSSTYAGVTAPYTWVPGHDITIAGLDAGAFLAGDSIKRVGTLQQMLSSCAEMYVRDGAYPDGFAGLYQDPFNDGLSDTAFQRKHPDNIFWSGYKIAQVNGRSLPPFTELALAGESDATFEFVLPWSRRAPRRIISLTDPHCYDVYDGGFPGRQLASCSVGDRAQWVNVLLNNTYRGVHELNSSGVWQEVPSGPDVRADVMDSDQPWKSNRWIPPGTLKHGDYFGWWLARDIVQTLRLYKWAACQPFSFRDGASSLLPGGGGEYSSIVVDGLTRAGAIAAFIAATPTVTFQTTNRVHTRYTKEIEGPDPTGHRLESTNCRMGFAVWKGVTGHVTTYGQAMLPSNGTAFSPETFDNQGIAAVVQDRFAALESHTIAAAGTPPTMYEVDAADIWSAHDIPPNWNPGTWPGHPHGFWIRGWWLMVKWTFDYT